MNLFIAFTIGFVGSLHCAGMCGPIAFALPLDRSKASAVWSGTLLYNVGRMLTYSMLGLAFGFLGYGLEFAGLQQALSIGIGLGILFLLVAPLFSKKIPFIGARFSLSFSSLKSALAKKFGNKSPINLLSIGLLNGLLPCGMVYLGLAGSTATGGPFQGALFMAFFGLGTLPMMLSFSLFKAQFPASFKGKFRKLKPILLFLIASLFVLRGMNLGIPYLSPKLQVENATSTGCYTP